MLRRIAEWEYEVEHCDGNISQYKLPVPPLPILPFPEDFQAILDAAPVQPFRGSLLLNTVQMDLQGKIKFILQRRNMYTSSIRESWKSLLRRLPKDNDSDRPDEHPNVLSELVRSFGRKCGIQTNFKPTLADLNDYGQIDPIQFTGGPIDHNQHSAFRRTIKDGERGCMRKRKKRKCTLSDSSDDGDAHSNKKLAVDGQHEKLIAVVPVPVRSIPGADVDIKLDILPLKRQVKQIRTGSSDDSSVVIECTDSDEKRLAIPCIINGVDIDVGRFQESVNNSIGSSKNDRVRLVLKTFSNRKSKEIISLLVQCANENEMLERLKVDGPDAMRFMFFYAAKDNLYDCVVGDGLCSVRTGRIMEGGKIVLIVIIFYCTKK